MKTIYVDYKRKILQHKKELEEKLNIKISLKNRNFVISGNEFDEFIAERVLMALDFPFLLDDALLLRSEEYLFEVLNIKDYTNRHDLNVIKGRIIGTQGKTLRVLRGLSNCEIVLKGNKVAIIGLAENIENATRSIIALIKGLKHGVVYGNLEKMNSIRRKREDY